MWDVDGTLILTGGAGKDAMINVIKDYYFLDAFDFTRILDALSLRFHTDIDNNTLLIFDEIQAAPRGITSLKYFYEKAPEYHVITAAVSVPLNA